MANNSDTVLSEDINSLSQKQKDVIIGTVLGDGSISSSGRGKYHFRFKQSVVHAEYLFFYVFYIYICKKKEK